MAGTKPNFSELARMHNVDRRTVKKYYEGYEGKPRSHSKPSKLDVHRTVIEQKLSIRGSNAKSVYEFLADQYADVGTYSNFKKYVNKNGLKPEKTKKGHPRFETEPGMQAQADWKEDLMLHSKDGDEYRFNVFNLKLSWSRFCVYTYSLQRTRQDVYESFIASFKTLGGVPNEILFDNMSSIVDLNGGRRKVNGRFAQFAKDFGFGVRLCKPRHSFTKGKVESNNKFIKWLLPYDYEFNSESELVAVLRRINEKVNSSVCQATNVPPSMLFQKEKGCLGGLPGEPVIASYMGIDKTATVQKDSLVYYKGSRYSVPPKYIGRQVRIKEDSNMLHLYFNTELVAIHAVGKKKIHYREGDYVELMEGRSNSADIELYARENLRLFDELL